MQITDSYAFLPREAVTRFLLGCTECNRHPRSPGSPTPSSAVITKDDDSVSADSVAASTSSAGPSHRGSPPPSSPSPAPSPSPSAPLLSPGLSAAASVSRLHPLPLGPEHADLYKRFADLPRESGGVANGLTNGLVNGMVNGMANGLLPYSYPSLPTDAATRSRYLASSPSSPVSPDLTASSRFVFSPPSPSASPSPSPSPLSRPVGSVGILSRNGPSAFHTPADHGKQNGQPNGGQPGAPTNGHVDGQHADDIRTRSPALAEALLLPLREDASKDESLFKQPLPSALPAASPVFLHTPTGRKTDVSLTPLTASEKLASSPFSIENISKSSRSSPTPPEHFAVPEPPRPRSPRSTPGSSRSDDNFLVPRPPKPRPAHALLRHPPRAPSPAGPSAYPLLQPLETVAPRTAVTEPAASVCVPVPVRAVPAAPPSRPSSSIMAGYEPAAGSGLLNLLLKSGVLRNCGPRTAIPEAGEIDLNMPITTTYLKYMRSLGYADEDALQIDVEMSLYQHVLGVPLKVVDDYL